MPRRRNCILPRRWSGQPRQKETAATIAAVSPKCSFAQFFNPRQIVEREILVRKAGFLDARPQHERLIALVKGAVGLKGSRTPDAAAEILDVLEAQRLEQKAAGRIALDRDGQQRLLVDPHFEPVVGDFAGL